MQKKVVAIDIDDVVADTVGAIVHNLSLMSGKEITDEHFKHPGEYWGYYEDLIKRLGLGEEFNYETVVSAIEKNSHLIYPVDGAQEALSRMMEKVDVVFITARHFDRETETKKWVEKYFGVPEKFVHVIGNNFAGPLRPKGEVCLEIGADWLIDDNPEHCLSAIEYGLNAILFGDYGWHFNAPDHLHRAKTWKEVEQFLDE